MAEERNLKKEIEAILFAAGRMVELDEISRLCKEDKSKVEPLLKEIKADYESSDSPMFLIQEGNGWKMTVREKYLGIIKDVAPHTELNKALLETLAIVAWKQPVMQADVVKIRGSTSYEHISQLVEMGFLTKIKHGRSYVLKPSTRFFDYFDLPSKEAVKEVFKDVELTDNEKRKALGEKLGEQQRKMDEIKEKIGALQVYDTQGEGKEGEEGVEAEKEEIKEMIESKDVGKFDVYEEKEEGTDEEGAEEEEEGKEEDRTEDNETKEEVIPEEKEVKDDNEVSGEDYLENEEKRKKKKEGPKRERLSKQLEEFAGIKEKDYEAVDEEKDADSAEDQEEESQGKEE